MIALVIVAGVSITLYFSQRDEYISKDEAASIALKHANVDHAPQGLRITLREDPPRWAETSATWGVHSSKPYVDYMIDAETGEILLVGNQGHLRARRGLVFPVLEQRVGEQAGLGGRLVRRDRCLVIESAVRTALPLWPPGYTYEKDQKVIDILDENGMVVAEVGSRIQLVGGAGSFLPVHLRGQVKPCPGGHYWAISLVVNE
jgi:hypothetical protein